MALELQSLSSQSPLDLVIGEPGCEIQKLVEIIQCTEKNWDGILPYLQSLRLETLSEEEIEYKPLLDAEEELHNLLKSWSSTKSKPKLSQLIEKFYEFKDEELHKIADQIRSNFLNEAKYQDESFRNKASGNYIGKGKKGFVSPEAHSSKSYKVSKNPQRNPKAEHFQETYTEEVSNPEDFKAKLKGIKLTLQEQNVKLEETGILDGIIARVEDLENQLVIKGSRRQSEPIATSSNSAAESEPVIIPQSSSSSRQLQVNVEQEPETASEDMELPPQTNIIAPKVDYTRILVQFLTHFVSMPEKSFSYSCKKSVIEEVWRNLPLEILRMKTKDSEKSLWSIETINMAIWDAEQLRAGYSRQILIALLDFNKDPGVKVLIDKFITANRCKIVHRYAEINTPWDIVDSPINWNQKLFGVSKDLLTILFLVALFICVSLLTFSIFNQSNSPQTLSLVSFSSNTTTNISKILSNQRIQKLPPVKYNLTVRTYQEYQQTMFKLPFDKEVFLTIDVNDPLKWQFDVPLGNTHTIKKLRVSGTLSIKAIINILIGMQNVNSLIVNDKTGSFCRSKERLSEYFNKKVTLPNINYLHFENFKDCSNFYEIFSGTLVMRNVVELKLTKSEMKNTNKAYLQKIITTSSKYMQSIEIIHCIVDVSIFDKALGPLLNVESIRFDLPKHANSSQVVFDRDFGRIFPRLKSFVSNSGLVPLDQFFLLVDCRNLHTLKVGIQLPEGQSQLDLYSLMQGFSSIKDVEFTFYFMGFNSERGCDIEGKEKALLMVKRLSFRSNCPDPSSLPQH